MSLAEVELVLRWRYNRSLDFFVDDDDAPDEKANELCVALVQVRTRGNDIVRQRIGCRRGRDLCSGASGSSRGRSRTPLTVRRTNACAGARPAGARPQAARRRANVRPAR